MKLFTAIALLLAVIYAAVPSKAESGVCQDKVADICGRKSSLVQGEGINGCDARYGVGIERVEKDFGPYINLHLNKSYQYLLLATYFNSYQKNRPGFQKLYQKLSDRSFDDTIDLIKQITKRGGIVDLNKAHYTIDHFQTRNPNLEVDEVNSLALALDNEKHLAQSTFHMHSLVTHSNHHDPEMTQYFEEKFVGPQAKTIRQISGYANDLAKMMEAADPSLSVYLFDEYMQKQ